MAEVLVSMIIAFCGYSLLNIAQACQKIGLGMMGLSRLKGTIVWVFATLATTASSFVILYAVSMGSVSLVGAMAGTGLASLSLFSALVMREEIRGSELAGVFVVLGAAVLIGLFSTETEAPGMAVKWLYVFLGAVVLTGALAILLLRVKRGSTGVATGCVAGALGGFIPWFQKISTSQLGKTSSLVHLVPETGTSEPGAQAGLLYRAGEIFANHYTAMWIALSVVSMIVLQFAFKRDRAIRIIPAFTASIILVPVVGGIFFFGERLTVLQLVGIALILFGVLLITLKRNRKAS